MLSMISMPTWGAAALARKCWRHSSCEWFLTDGGSMSEFFALQLTWHGALLLTSENHPPVSSLLYLRRRLILFIVVGVQTSLMNWTFSQQLVHRQLLCFYLHRTRKPASVDSTACRQFQFQNLFISRVHLFYHIQWKQICGIPFIKTPSLLTV